MVSLRTLLVLLLAPTVLLAGPPTPPADTTPSVRFEADGVRKGAAVAVLRNKNLKEEGGKAVVPLAEQPTLTLTLEGPSPLIVEEDEKALLATQKKALEAGGGWTAKASKPVVTQLPDRRERWEALFTLDPRDEGDHQLQPAPLAFRDGSSATTQQASWKPISVKVISRVAKPQSATDLSQMRDIVGPEDPPGGQKSTLRDYLKPGAIIAAVLLLCGALVAAFWTGIRRRLGQFAPLPPNRWALRELDRIASMDLATPGASERLHTEASDVIRHYLERRFGLRAPQQTTAEFLARMQSWPFLPAAQQALLREFLERCDLAKFAGVSPSPDDCRATAKMAREFVEQTQAIDLKAV